MVNRRPVDYRAIRIQVTPRVALERFGWRAVESTSRSCRGPCPFHGSKGVGSRILSCTTAVCFCHKCHWTGDAVAIWSRLSGENMLSAAMSLCDYVGIAVPFLT